jgi:hypothetical protein
MLLVETHSTENSGEPLSTLIQSYLFLSVLALSKRSVLALLLAPISTTSGAIQPNSG